ncbi:MAG: gliding motility-associated C-terminal domain-containing protein, partial [Flavobacterium sp.]
MLVFFFLLFHSTSNAQCAGVDNQVTICDITNPANQNINLFNYLLGSPMTGGTWIDNDRSGGLNPATGILNVTQINQSGTFEYIYVVNNSACFDDRASITVTIGGYAGIGVENPPGSACDDNDSVNLFQFIGGSPNPQINGNWSQVSGTPAIFNGNILDAAATGIGSYRFRYSLPAIGSCPESVTFVNLNIYPAPKPGTTRDLTICETADFSLYTNLNLLDFLIGQDSGGRWTEESGTSELSGPFDTFINVQNIYNAFGPGKYEFKYTVLPSHPICNIKTATVSIIIENQLDFTNSTLVVDSDICENEIATAVYTATLTQGVEAIPNGNYTIQYQITGAFNSTRTIVAAFNSGIMTFPIPRTSFPAVGAYTIKILNIHETTGYNTC